jgi:hypothetical protein
MSPKISGFIGSAGIFWWPLGGAKFERDGIPLVNVGCGRLIKSNWQGDRYEKVAI